MTKRYAFSYLSNGAPKRHPRLNDLPKHLKGPPQNRYGGHQTQRVRAFKGSSFGAANGGRTLGLEEKKIIEQELRERGALDELQTAADSEARSKPR